MYAVRASDAVAEFSAWSKPDRMHLVQSCLIVMGTIGLVEVNHVKISRNKSANIVRALPETLEWIDKRNNFVQFQCVRKIRLSPSRKHTRRFKATVVEQVYTTDLKSVGLTPMRVRFPPVAPTLREDI